MAEIRRTHYSADAGESHTTPPGRRDAMHTFETQSTPAAICAGQVTLHGRLHAPPDMRGLVIFALGNGNRRYGPRNRRVTEVLHDVGLATLFFDLLSPTEAPADSFNARLWFDVNLLAQRVNAATRWAREQPALAGLPVGYFGAGTGAAAVIKCAAMEGANISAIVTRGGRPDLANGAIDRLHVPTLLVVGGNDASLAALNLDVWARLRCEKAIEIIPGAGHRFEEPGALENVSALAARWFSEHLRDEKDFAG